MPRKGAIIHLQNFFGGTLYEKSKSLVSGGVDGNSQLVLLGRLWKDGRL